jgi:Family of unknown function (DUF6445)
VEHAPRVELRRIGREGRAITIVDDFARDPERLRKLAESADYQPRGDYYPGRRAPVPPDYFADVGQLLAGLFNRMAGPATRVGVERALFALVSTPAAELGLAQRVPHIDNPDPARFAIVHFLGTKDQGGTAFYRHRSTGFEAITPDRHRQYLDSLERDFALKGEPPPGYISGDTPLFERTELVPYRFNRAVVYPGNLLHCSANLDSMALADDPVTGRLTVTSFLVLEHLASTSN